MKPQPNRGIFDWHTVEEENLAVTGVEWEEPRAETRATRFRRASGRAARSFGWSIAAAVLVLLAVAVALLWWRGQVVEEWVRRDVQESVAREILIWQSGDAAEFASILDPEAEEGWREREMRRFRWLRAWRRNAFFSDRATVESVVRVGDYAEVRVLHETLGSGESYRTTSFYHRGSSRRSWRRTAPDERRWGSPRQGSTPRFHFVYRARDAATVERVMVDVEAFYDQLWSDTGGRPVHPAEPITVTIEPRTDVVSWRIRDGRISLISPVLQLVPDGSTADAELRRALGQPLARALIDEQEWAWKLPAAGRNFAHGVGDWSVEAWSGTESWTVAGHAQAMRQASARGWPLGVDAQRRWSPDMYDQLWHAHSYFLADYVATAYGRDAFAPLLEEWRTARRWKEVVPWALGVSYAEFEAGWNEHLQPVLEPAATGG